MGPRPLRSHTRESSTILQRSSSGRNRRRGVEKDRGHANEDASKSNGRVNDEGGDGGEDTGDINGEWEMFLEDDETIMRGGMPMWVGRKAGDRDHCLLYLVI